MKLFPVNSPAWISLRFLVPTQAICFLFSIYSYLFVFIQTFFIEESKSLNIKFTVLCLTAINRSSFTDLIMSQSSPTGTSHSWKRSFCPHPVSLSVLLPVLATHHQWAVDGRLALSPKETVILPHLYVKSPHVSRSSSSGNFLQSFPLEQIFLSSFSSWSFWYNIDHTLCWTKINAFDKYLIPTMCIKPCFPTKSKFILR